MKTQITIGKQESEKTNFTSVLKLHHWYGIIVSIILILFFVSMRILNFHEILYLRYINVVFLISGILLALIKYKDAVSGDLDYFTGIKTGIELSVWAVIPFTVFMWVYLSADTHFMQYIKDNTNFGEFLTPTTSAGCILIEGLVSGIIVTYIAMQYFKRNEM